MRQAIRLAALTVSLFLALVVAALPGTTSASSTPVRLATTAGPAALQGLDPVLVPLRFADLLPAIGIGSVLGGLEADRDLDVQVPPVTGTVTPPPTPTPVTSVLGHAQVVSVYGHPGVCVMGELGCHDPTGAVQAARDLAEAYDAVNGDRQTRAALHLIVDVAQANAGEDGRYLDQMPLDEIEEWVDFARLEDVLLFLDIQIGWGDVLTDVQRLGEFLAQPHVHLAIDPEFATESEGLAPGVAIGELRAADVNAVQEYLAKLVADHGIPPKVLVLHQFRADMLPDAHEFADVDGVDVTIDMDGWGGPWPKTQNYEVYAMAPYAERPAIKLFFHWDEPLMTPAEIMALPVPPDYVIYQ